MAGLGGAGGSIAEWLFRPRPLPPTPPQGDLPTGPPIEPPTDEALAPQGGPLAGPGLVDQVRAWLRSQSAPSAAEAAPSSPVMSPDLTERMVERLRGQPSPPPVETRRDPFLETLYPGARELGHPIAGRMGDPGSEQVATGHRNPPMGVREGMQQTAQMVGDATPLEGIAGAAVSRGLGLADAFDPSRSGIAHKTGRPMTTLRGVPPDVSQLRKLYREGVKLGGSEWYRNFGRKIIAEHGPESRRYAGVVASLSPLREAGALKPLAAKRLGAGAASKLEDIGPEDLHRGSNLLLAEKVWDAYKTGGIPGVERVLGQEQARLMRELGEEGIGVLQTSRVNVLRALHGQEIGSGDEARKIRAFRDALMGDPQAIVLDTWMKKIFYPIAKDPDAPKWKRGTEPVLEPRIKYDPKTGTIEEVPKEYSAFTVKQYDEVSEIIRKFAAKVGATPADVQAALWVAKKYEEQGGAALAGSMPFVDSMKIVQNFLGKELKNFAPEVALALAGAGAVLGMGMLGGDEAESAEPVTTGARQTMEP